MTEPLQCALAARPDRTRVSDAIPLGGHSQDAYGEIT